MNLTMMLNASKNPISKYVLIDEVEITQQQQTHDRSICTNVLSQFYGEKIILNFRILESLLQDYQEVPYSLNF